MDHNQIDRRGQDVVYAGPIYLGKKPSNGKHIPITEVLPGARGLSPTLLCSLGRCSRKLSPQNFCFESQWGLSSAESENLGNRLLLKSTCRGCSLKRAWVRPTCYSWRASWEAGGTWDFTWEWRHWWHLLGGAHSAMMSALASAIWESFP